jgi:hypothetical protein
MNYLVSVVEVWRVADDVAADVLEKEFRDDDTYDLTAFAKADKKVTKGGEVIEEWVQIKATKKFNDEKKPDSDVRPAYK